MLYLLTWIREHHLAFLRLLLAAAVLWLACWGGTALYDRLTASPAKWQAEMNAGQTAISHHDIAAALGHYQAAVREARKFGPHDLRLAGSLVQSARFQAVSVYFADEREGELMFCPVNELVSDRAKRCFSCPMDFFRNFCTFLHVLQMRDQLYTALHDLSQSEAIIEKTKGKDDSSLTDPLELQQDIDRMIGEDKKVLLLLQRAYLIKKTTLW